MPKDGNNQVKEITVPVNAEKTVQILQATFEHYFKMAMDHHTKAATTSNILLIIVGAIIGLVGKQTGGVAFVGGLAVSFIGLFGSVWVWKQHERYHYWEHIAYEYQKELSKIVPGLKTGEDKEYKEYKDRAEKHTAKEFGYLFSVRILDRYLWVSLHIIVAGIGLVLMAHSQNPNFIKELVPVKGVIFVVGLIILLWVITLIRYYVIWWKEKTKQLKELQGNTK